MSEGPLDVHALDHLFQGVVLELVDADQGRSRAELLESLRTEVIPARLAGSDAMMCLICVHADLPEIIKSPRLPGKYENGESRVVLMWFLESDPRKAWEREFSGHVTAVKETGMGRWCLWDRLCLLWRGLIGMLMRLGDLD